MSRSAIGIKLTVVLLLAAVASLCLGDVTQALAVTKVDMPNCTSPSCGEQTVCRAASPASLSVPVPVPVAILIARAHVPPTAVVSASWFEADRPAFRSLAVPALAPRSPPLA